MESQSMTNNSNQKIVTLNVGGAVYATTLSTLLRFPDSMLGRMFSKESTFHLEKDEDGRVFIDRDGAPFRHILNYLRSNIVPSSDSVREELRHEADYYQITPLVEALTEPEAPFIPASELARESFNMVKDTPMYKRLIDMINKCASESKTLGYCGFSIDIENTAGNLNGDLIKCIGAVKVALIGEGYDVCHAEGVSEIRLHVRWLCWGESRTFSVPVKRFTTVVDESIYPIKNKPPSLSTVITSTLTMQELPSSVPRRLSQIASELRKEGEGLGLFAPRD